MSMWPTGTRSPERPAQEGHRRGPVGETLKEGEAGGIPTLAAGSTLSGLSAKAAPRRLAEHCTRSRFGSSHGTEPAASDRLQQVPRLRLGYLLQHQSFPKSTAALQANSLMLLPPIIGSRSALQLVGKSNQRSPAKQSAGENHIKKPLAHSHAWWR